MDKILSSLNIFSNISPSSLNPTFKDLFMLLKGDDDLLKKNLRKIKIETLSEENSIIHIIEFLIVSITIALTAPLLLLIALAVKFTSPGPIIFSQRRVGHQGQIFNIYKFRTMVNDAELKSGPILSWDGDPRITKLGFFLRKFHLDEIPQLFNVLLGHMSIIGPRPERPELIANFIDDVPSYREREKVRPGITGLAQICLPYNATPGEKLTFDLFFIMHRKSLLINVMIIYYTTLKMLFGTRVLLRRFAI